MGPPSQCSRFGVCPVGFRGPGSSIPAHTLTFGRGSRPTRRARRPAGDGTRTTSAVAVDASEPGRSGCGRGAGSERALETRLRATTGPARLQLNPPRRLRVAAGAEVRLFAAGLQMEAVAQLSSAAEGASSTAAVLASVGGLGDVSREPRGVEACQTGNVASRWLEIESGVGRVGCPRRLESALCL
jgi:hypothetical protein